MTCGAEPPTTLRQPRLCSSANECGFRNILLFEARADTAKDCLLSGKAVCHINILGMSVAKSKVSFEQKYGLLGRNPLGTLPTRLGYKVQHV